MSHIKIIFLLIINTLLYANPIMIDKDTKELNILPYSKILIDKSQELTIDQIIKKENLFLQNDKGSLAYGYDPKINIWVKFTIKNNSDKSIHKLLEYSNSLTTNIEFFSPSDGYKIPIDEGLFKIKEGRKTIRPTFSIQLGPNESKTYYLKATSKITTLIVKLTVFDKDKFYEKEIYHQSVLSLFFGAMFILAFYNIFIYFFTKDLSYLYYVLYILGTSLHHSIYTGVSNIYFSQAFIINSIEYSAIIVALPIFALGLFTKNFLQIYRYKRLNFILNILLISIPISLVFFSFTESYDQYRNTLTLILMLYLVYLTVYSSLKRNKQAYFILFGWIIIFFALLFMVLSSLGVFDIYNYMSYYIEVTLLIEAVVFAIALADRINSLQKDKNTINEKLIKQQETETKRLYNQVKEKTKNLTKALSEKDLLLKELNHRVKNNMQTIVSLIRLQNDELDDDRLQDVLITIQNRINAMSHLHELLYRQDDISHINAYEYFEILIEEVMYSYEKDIAINLNIKANLEMEQAIYCGLILNELITNSYKYAFPYKSGKIDVNLSKEDTTYTLIVKDNGIGYKEKAALNSLGLTLVNTLVREQLDGDIKVNSTNGVENTIRWKDYEKKE